MWSFSEPVICFVGGNLIGNHKELLQWAQDEYSYEDFRPAPLYSAMASEAYNEYFTNSEVCFVSKYYTLDF